MDFGTIGDVLEGVSLGASRRSRCRRLGALRSGVLAGLARDWGGNTPTWVSTFG